MDGRFLEIIAWICVPVTCVGLYLVAKKNRITYYLFGAMNLWWGYYHFVGRKWRLVTAMMIYFGFNIYGYIQWRRDDTGKDGD